MIALESPVLLVALWVAGTSDIGKTLVVEIDNVGTVGVFAREYCTDCPYSTTLVHVAFVLS